MTNYHLPYRTVLSCISFALLSASLSQQASAQCHTIYNQRIMSLQVVAAQRWQAMPVAEMGETVHIDFDDMTHEYRRYNYKIEHCDADWNPSSDLFVSDYLKGFNGELTIDDNEQSVNTNHLYTHYSLSIPNEHCQLTMSGNYRLTVFADDDESQPMFTACFMLVDPQITVALAVTGNTDIDIYKSHQQVSMTAVLGDVRVNDPRKQIKTVVLQNGRWDNAVRNASPDYVSSDALQWRHVRNLIFPAGNEYRKFEMLDLDHTTMGLDSILWDGREAHAFVMPDLPRPNYVYDESGRGAFYLRNSDNTDNDFTSDYAQVHFFLQAPPQQGEVYLNGNWTCGQFLPKYRMSYDAAAHAYRASVLLKEGYYSYQYLTVGTEGQAVPVSTEGCFCETQNRFQALVYFRGTADRTDRLLGYGEVQVKTEKP